MARTEAIHDTLPRAQANSRPETWTDVVVIGAGPTGLACAIEAQRVGFKVMVIDKGCLVNSIFHYPANMTFFTTPELLEIGDIPFNSANMKPTRHEALEYYRNVAQHYRLNVHQYEWVKTVTGEDGSFRVTTSDRSSKIHDYRTRKVILSTGYYDLPNYMNIPGEDLAKVFHYYHEPHPYYDTDVVVIGGKNSAAEAALDLFRGGASVTLIHRGAEMGKTVKYWVRPDIENRFKAGEVKPFLNSRIVKITKTTVEVDQLAHI